MSMCYSSNINIKPIASVARHSDHDFSFPTKGVHKQNTDREILVKPEKKKKKSYCFFSAKRNSISRKYKCSSKLTG